MRPLIIMHGENIDWCHTVIRMLMYLVGVAVLALGMSLQTASGLGVAALTCFATTLSMLTGKTLGFWITATYVAYIVAQLAILRSEFQPRILLELFFSTLIGGLTDLFMAVNPLHPTALPTQIATMLLSLAVTAFGVSLVVNMGVVPNAPDGLVQVIAEKLKRRFGDVKVVFDCSHVAASLALSLIFMYNLGGFGVTTAISALFLGHVINVPTSCSPSALSARHLENSTTAKPARSTYFAISHYTLLYLAILCYILLYLEQRWLTCKQTLLSPQQVKHLPRLSAAKMCSKNSMRASSTGLVPRDA